MIDEYDFAQREREYLLDQAKARAEAGEATQEDFDIIRFECGKPRYSPSKQVLNDVFEDFGNVFGGTYNGK